MTNKKQKRTAMELSDSLVREIRYYCEENGIDTTLGFELAKSIRRENDLVATYVDLGEDGYADWISDIITNHFEEEKEDVNMENKEHILETESARMEKRDLEIILWCLEAMIECSDGVPLDQPAHHNAKFTMGELIAVYEMMTSKYQLVPDKITEPMENEVTISYQEAIERAQQGTLPTCPHLEKVKVFKACYGECIIQYVFGTECYLSDDWVVEELGYLSYINMTNKDEELQRVIDEYLDGDAGSCRKDCVHYKSCNE